MESVALFRFCPGGAEGFLIAFFGPGVRGAARAPRASDHDVVRHLAPPTALCDTSAMPRPPSRLAWWFRRLLFAALVALLPWVACPFSPTGRFMMVYTVEPIRYGPRDPARDPSRALSMSITVEAGLLGRAERVEVLIAQPTPIQAEVDIRSLRWRSPTTLASTAISPLSAAAFLQSGRVLGDDALLLDLGADLDMLLRRITSQGVGALNPDFAPGNPGVPMLRDARALKPVFPSVGTSVSFGRIFALISGLTGAALALVIILTGFLHPRETTARKS